MKPMTFEEGMQRLSAIREEMKSGERSLEDNLALYKEARTIGDLLHKQLDEAELKIRTIDGEDVSIEVDDVGEQNA